MFHFQMFFWVWILWKGCIKVTKIWISQEWKELKMKKKTIFKEFLKGYHFLNIIISSFKMLKLYWNMILVLAKLVTTWCTYRKTEMPHLRITVFWCCGNFLDKRKLMYFIKQTLQVHFAEPINWLGLYFSYNLIMQSLKTVSTIFL